jgi:hypothetical protein
MVKEHHNLGAEETSMYYGSVNVECLTKIEPKDDPRAQKLWGGGGRASARPSRNLVPGRQFISNLPVCQRQGTGSGCLWLRRSDLSRRGSSRLLPTGAHFNVEVLSPPHHTQALVTQVSTLRTLAFRLTRPQDEPALICLHKDSIRLFSSLGASLTGSPLSSGFGLWGVSALGGRSVYRFG